MKSVMAAGRGEFFRSFIDGLKLAEPAPGRPQLGRGRGPGPGRGQSGGKRGKRPPKTAPRPVSGNVHSCPEPGRERRKADFSKIKTSTSEENFMERLPSEVLIKILSYLDASSLFCIGHVSKLFHRLANDDVIWHEIYMSDFGGQTWRPNLAGDAAQKVEPVEVEHRSTGHWKKLYFRTMARQEINEWRRILRDTSPHTGLPRHTKGVLRNLNVSWELTVCDCFGWQSTLQQSQVYFFESSVIVCWSRGSFPIYHHISTIQLHGVRKRTPKSPRARMDGWRSLISKLDLKAQPGRFIGRDGLIKLKHLSPGFLVGLWRGQSRVAFIMVCLHFHKLVERSLLGTPVCPYSEPVDRPPVDNSDPEFGLHGYTLHVVLHTISSEIMSAHFRQLACRRVQIQRGLVELRVIHGTNLSQHRSLSGNIKLSWRSNALEGSVENCCIIMLTLLDEFQKPFWCVSSPVCITMAKKSLSVNYSGRHFLGECQNPEGQVKMKLVWLEEQKHFFLIGLSVYVPVYRVNKHFSREY